MYGLVNKNHLIDITKTVCDVLGYGEHESADLLILGTIAQETNLGQYKDQTAFKYGSGICQIEEIAFYDIQLRTSEKNYNKILNAFGVDLKKVTYEMLEYNVFLSILYCRLFYLLIPEQIPSDVLGIGRYWKKYYNTEKGKGSVEQFVANFNLYIRREIKLV